MGNVGLQHGARLPSERSLADQFKVSRSSVREAIRSLELQGLVVSRRGAGTFINTENLESVVALIATTLSSGSETLQEIFEVRHLLEPQIVAVAPKRASPEEIEQLEDILGDQQRQISRGQTGVDADTAFHFALASATHNSALVKVVSAVEDILRLSRDYPTFPIWLNIPLSKSSAFFKPLSICETLAVGMAIITP